MASAEELRQQLEEAEKAEAEAAAKQESNPDSIVPQGKLDTAAKEIAHTYIELLSQIGLQFGEGGELLVPENAGQMLDTAFKTWFTFYKNEPKSSQKQAQQRPNNQQNNNQRSANNNPAQNGQRANIGGGGNRRNNANGRSAFCGCDCRCSMEYENNQSQPYDCGCDPEVCLDTTYGGSCNCIRRDGEILEKANGKWRWLPEAA